MNHIFEECVMEEYKHNHISNVISRADFSTPIFALKDDVPKELGTICTSISRYLNLEILPCSK